MGQQRLEQVGQTLAMFGGKGDGFAQAKAKRFHHAALRRLALGLVGHQHHRRVAFAQPAGDLLVQRGDAGACIDQEQSDVAILDSRLGLQAHAARQRLRVLILIAGGVDDGEVQAQQMRLPLAPVAGHAGLVVHQRQLLADQPVEQGGLAHIGASDDRYRGQHGPIPSTIITIDKNSAPAKAGTRPGWRNRSPAFAGARLAFCRF